MELLYGVYNLSDTEISLLETVLLTDSGTQIWISVIKNGAVAFIRSMAMRATPGNQPGATSST